VRVLRQARPLDDRDEEFSGEEQRVRRNEDGDQA